ncbi:MFS transporter [Streptomyces sp. NTK 937]|uniref:MFS transporter n=1 Tax=Streptomyces sp. NTK 937 TaxID=1487711 RepID=UPI000AAAC51C
MEGIGIRSPPPTRRWLGLIAIALGVALIVVDTTIVNVIVPSLVEDPDATSAQAQWVQESYAIVFAALLLLTGRLADIFGARRVFVIGAVLFGATSVLAGLAPGSGLLILARFLQGASAAMLLPTSLSLLKATFTGKARGQAFAVWGSTIGAAAALGPVLGGWLAEHVSWRWAFGINVPLSVLVVAGVLLCIAPSPRTHGRIDVPCGLLSVISLGLLAFGLVEGRTYGWFVSIRPLKLFGFTWDGGPSPVLVALVLFVLAMGVFVRRQLSLGRSGDSSTVLMDVSLFSISSFRGGNIATLIIGIGEFGIVAVLPLWPQFTLGYTPCRQVSPLYPSPSAVSSPAVRVSAWPPRSPRSPCSVSARPWRSSGLPASDWSPRRTAHGGRSRWCCSCTASVSVSRLSRSSTSSSTMSRSTAPARRPASRALSVSWAPPWASPF